MAAGSSSLVQRGWLLFRLATGRTVRVPVPSPNVSLPSGKAQDLWHNMLGVLWTRSRLCQELAASIPVLIMYVSDAASCNRSMVSHEVDGAVANTYVVHALCLAHQAHICARSQHIHLGQSSVTHLSSASRIFAVGSGPQPLPTVMPTRAIGRRGDTVLALPIGRRGSM